MIDGLDYSRLKKMLSIVIPCFNEEKNIAQTVNRILTWSNDKNLNIELILFDFLETYIVIKTLILKIYVK